MLGRLILAADAAVTAFTVIRLPAVPVSAKFCTVKVVPEVMLTVAG